MVISRGGACHEATISSDIDVGRVPAETSAILRSGIVAPVRSRLYSAKDTSLKSVVKMTIMG